MVTQPASPLTRADDVLLEKLSCREEEVLQRVAAGHRNHEIAAELHVSIKTVEYHLSNILGKLCARSRTEAAMRASRLGMLELSRPC